MNIKTICTTLALITSCASLANAHEVAFHDDDAPSVKFSYRDLDLSNPVGGRVMLARIRHAAKQVCGPEPTDPMQHRWQYTPCVNQAIERAVARLDSPVVTALNGGAGSKDRVAMASR